MPCWSGCSAGLTSVLDAQGNAWFAWGDCSTSNCTGTPAGNYRVSETMAGGGATTFSQVLATTPQGPDCPYATCGFAYFGPQDAIAMDSAGTMYLAWQAGQSSASKSPPVISLSRCQGSCLSAASWVALATGTRPDAVIYGPVPTGVEVQRYAMTAQAAIKRSAKAQASSVLDVWCLWFTNRTPAPKWVNKVPSVSELSLPWDAMPPRRSAVAAGLRIIEAARCTVDNFQCCPDGGARRCGRLHPRDEPWIGLYVDDVAARVPAGQIVPMRFRRNSRSSDVLLVPKSSLDLYEESTGRLASVVLSPVAEMVPATRPACEVECCSDQPDKDDVILCFKCGKNPVGPGGIICPLCRLDIETSDGYTSRRPTRGHSSGVADKRG